MVNKNIYLGKPWLAHYDSHVKPQLPYPDINLAELLDMTAQSAPDLVFLIHRDENMTFRQAGKLIASFSVNLYAMGLAKGDRVAVLLPNCPQFVIAYYAILKAGGVVVALNPNYGTQEFRYLLADCKPKFIICQQRHLDELPELKQKPHNMNVIVSDFPDEPISTLIACENGGNETGHGVSFLSMLKKSGTSTPVDGVKIDASDPAIFQYSGGTTGMPKAAIGLHRNIIANVLQFINWCDLEKHEEKILAAIPLYHVYGMVLAMNMGVALGATIVLIDDPRDIDFMLDQIERYQIRFFPAVPAIYHAISIHQRARQGQVNMKSIKACISGSYPLHPNIKHQFEKMTGGRLIEGYGLSEAPTATHCNPLYGINKEGSIGLPLPDVDCRVVDVESGLDDVEINCAGELIIQAPQVMAGYFHTSPGEAQALRNGWLYTGDVVRMDQEGYFYIVDRKKSMIKVGGLQVWPNEIEAVINRHPKVLESAAGGIPEPVAGEKVVAWVVPEENQKMDEAEIVAWCQKHLASYKLPSEIIFVDQLPKTGVGKILRRELITAYINKNPHPS